MATAKTKGVTDGKSTLLTILLPLILCLSGAGIGYFGVSNGMVPLTLSDVANANSKPKVADRPDVAFVTIPTLLITMPPGAENKHLRFSAVIEVPSEFESEIAFLMPRIQDMMNGYLRALRAEDIEGPGSIFRIRMHLYRRIVSVVGLEKTRGLLITEFILK